MDNKKVQGRMLRSYAIRFLLQVLVFSVVYVGLAFLAIFIGTSITWYYNDFWYPLAVFVRDNFVILGILGYAAGLLVILFLQWRRIAKETAALVNVIERIAQHDNEPVTLPEGLADVQLLLQQVQLEARRNDEMAREAEQRKNDLVVYLAHDLKTPLTSVLGYLTLLRDEQDISPGLQHKYLGIATTKAERLEDLINEFFEITRFNLKGLVLEQAHFNFSRLLEQVNDEFRPLYAEKALVPILDIERDIEMEGDPGKLERVIDNLLRNAANYSHRGSEIRIHAHVQDGRLFMEVQNKGDTIPEHKLAHIFEQFYRLDSSRSTAAGAGLGLAIAKEIVDLHGGSIAADSADETVTFRVELPLAMGQDSLSTPPVNPAPPTPGTIYAPETPAEEEEPPIETCFTPPG